MRASVSKPVCALAMPTKHENRWSIGTPAMVTSGFIRRHAGHQAHPEELHALRLATGTAWQGKVKVVEPV